MGYIDMIATKPFLLKSIQSSHMFGLSSNQSTSPGLRGGFLSTHRRASARIDRISPENASLNVSLKSFAASDVTRWGFRAGVRGRGTRVEIAMGDAGTAII
jgi:hypothetical protein